MADYFIYYIYLLGDVSSRGILVFCGVQTMNDLGAEIERVRDEKAKAWANSMWQSSMPDYPQTFRKRDQIEFSERDYSSGFDAALAHHPVVIELANTLSHLWRELNNGQVLEPDGPNHKFIECTLKTYEKHRGER
jgi:hypothetical protein